MQFMMSDPNTSSLDVALVRNIVTGKISRHPALQGVLIGCITKLNNIDAGKTTMRNRHRVLEVNGLWFIYVHVPMPGI